MEKVTNGIWEYGADLFTGGLLSFSIRLVIIILITYYVSKLIHRTFSHLMNKASAQSMALHFSERLLKTLLYIFAVYLVLTEIKPLSSIGNALIGATGVISVFLGLAAQESAGNFIAGFMLALFHPFKVVDYIELKDENVGGIVTAMNFRHTVLTTVEGSRLIVPNSKMNSSVVEDRVFGQEAFTRYINVSISYQSDVDLAMSLILEAADEVHGLVDRRSEKEKLAGKPRFIVRLEDFGDSGIVLRFPVYTKNYASSYIVASEMRKKIFELFRKNGIEIPYTTFTVFEGKNS